MDPKSTAFYRAQTHGETRLKLLESSIFNCHDVIFFIRNNILHPAINSKVKHLADFGILRKFDELIYLGMDIKPKEYEAVVLKMDHLYIGFLIWLASLGLTFVVFLIEIAFFRISRILTKFLKQ